MAETPIPTPPAAEGDAPDPATALRQQLTPIAMSNDELAEWKARIEASQQRTKAREQEWDTLVEEYDPTVDQVASAGSVKANTHFRNTHTKIGQLFVRSPKVILFPKGPANDKVPIPGPMGQPMPAAPADAVATRQAVLNYFIGPDEIDILRVIDVCLLDMLSYSGFAGVLCEYRSTTKMADQPVMGPDPMHVPDPMNPTPQPPPMVPLMGPDGMPVTQSVPVVIHEQWAAERVSPKAILFDDLLRSSQYVKHSRWIGRRHKISKRIAKKQFGLSDEELQTPADDDDRVHKYKNDEPTNGASSKDQVWYTEVWYYACHFLDPDAENGYPNAIHPEAIVRLVLFDCVADRPVVHEPYRHQKFTDEGQLEPGSLRRFPLKIGSLRDAVDSPFPKSDAAFTHALVLQLNTFLQQSVKLRDAAIGQYFYDSEAITPDDLAKMTNGEVGAKIGLKSGALAQGAEKIFYTTAQVHASADDWRTIGLLKSYMDETLGISATQAGATTDTVRSATEINAVGASAAGRQQKEQSRVIAFFLEIVRDIDMLIWRYAIGDRWIALTGPTGQQKLAMWNKALSGGEFMYDIEPDSQLVTDAARDRQQKVAAYNVMGKDPLFRRIVAIRDIARLCGWDPTEAVISEQEAQQMQQLQQVGVPAGQPPVQGGPMNKHQQEQSGGAPNAPGAPGNNRQERNPPPPGQMARPTP